LKTDTLTRAIMRTFRLLPPGVSGARTPQETPNPAFERGATLEDVLTDPVN
jgi:hypothetical protein